MENKRCVLGCMPLKNLYLFPNRKYDKDRRKAWLDFFGLEEPNTDYIYACNRHFSQKQRRRGGVPDIPIICDGSTLSSFKRQSTSWRKNVIVVTPKDPEFTIYRHETGIFPQNLFVSEPVQPVIHVPTIKSVSCSMSTQTNTRLCGLVQISDMKEDYHLNCFYCSEIFAIEKWQKFVDHIKRFHYKKEEAFKMPTFFLNDHDYTPMNSTCNTMSKSSVNFKTINNSFGQMPAPQTALKEHIVLPPLLAKPQIGIKKISENFFEIPQSVPPPLLARPHQSNDTFFNISLADQLIKLLNDTILSPNFLHTEEDNILIIKNAQSDSIETSNFLTNMNSECNSIPTPAKFIVKAQNPKTNSSSKVRSIHTINYGQQYVPSRRYPRVRPPFPKIKCSKRVQRQMVKRTLKHINVFENIYKTVKRRGPQSIESDDVDFKDVNISKETEQQILKRSSLSRFLKRTFGQMTETRPKKDNSTQIVFEYTPKEIIVLLLDSMKNYPVLWEFHEQPYNKRYNAAIEELCKIINDKWSLNITPLKMRYSINRILRFYRFMLPRESIDEFEEYFDKCAMFLPSSVDGIPRERCPYCCICYKNHITLRNHLILRHNSLKWSYKCELCWERFWESDDYELHKRLPHFEEIFKCEECGKRFNRLNRYNQHVDCHKKTAERRIEETEEKAQTTSYDFMCDKCNVKFRFEYQYKRHLKSHLNALEEHKCRLCQKSFCSKTSLKVHIRRHNKEFTVICEICGKGFFRNVELREHMATHTGAKITCNICNLKLNRSSLHRHLRLVHVAVEGTITSTHRARSHNYKRVLGPITLIRRGKRAKEKTSRRYGCKTCKINFVNLKFLKDHNKIMHCNVKKTPCKICNVEFIYIPNLKRHYREKHKLHIVQVFYLVNRNEDLNKVLAMKTEDLDYIADNNYMTNNLLNNEDNVKTLNDREDDSYSTKIQEEIMKAVENIDRQEEIQASDDISMKDFFADLFSKNSEE